MVIAKVSHKMPIIVTIESGIFLLNKKLAPVATPSTLICQQSRFPHSNASRWRFESCMSEYREDTLRSP